MSGQTGVSAEATGATEVTLTSANGADINIQADAVLTDVPNDDTIFQAGVILSTTVSDVPGDGDGSIVLGGADAADFGLSEGASTASREILNDVDVLTRSNANDAILSLDFALDQVNSLRAELGAVQVRFEATISNLQVAAENQSAARSRIRDADFAAETAELTRNQILQQAGIAVLSQANAQPQNVLALLQ